MPFLPFANAPGSVGGAVNVHDGSGNTIGSNNGALNVYLTGQLAGEDLINNVLRTEGQFSYSYISTATTTLVKSGAGFLHTITVNGGTAGTIIVYDKTTAVAPIIVSFDSTNALITYTFDCIFTTGLTIVTGAATKLTVSYR